MSLVSKQTSRLRPGTSLSDRPLDILLITFNMAWRGGGTFYRAFGFGSELASRGHKVTLLTTSLEARLRITEDSADGVRIVQSPAVLNGGVRSGWDPYDILRRCSWLRRRSFDIVHGFESRPVVIYPALFAEKWAGARLILDWCDWLGRGGQRVSKNFRYHLETYFEENFRHRARATTVICRPLAARAENLGIDPTTIHLLRNGADTKGIKSIDRQKARSALGLAPDARLVGHLGQALLQDRDFLATAFARVRDELPESRLMLIGNYQEDIVEHLRRDAVIETGYVRGRRLNQYLAACDVVWLPLNDTLANRGRWPMKLSDYMASGRAIVSTSVGDWIDLFKGENPIGLLATPDPGDFAQKTLSLLADPESLGTYERNARYIACHQLGWPSLTGKLESIYYDTIATQAPTE